MTVRLLPGIYPQIPTMYTRVNSKLWDEKTFKKHGHHLLSLKVFELTLRSDGESKLYSEIRDKSLMAKLSHAMIRGNRRTTNQIKSNVTWDMTLVSVDQVEKASRAEIDLFNPDKKKAGKDVQLIVETMITLKDGMKCSWHNIYKEGQGEVMVLTYVNRKHIGKMEREDVLSCLELGWENEVCTMDNKEIRRKEVRTVCGDSHITIKQLKSRRK
jgi:hypothetical protein